MENDENKQPDLIGDWIAAAICAPILMAIAFFAPIPSALGVYFGIKGAGRDSYISGWTAACQTLGSNCVPRNQPWSRGAEYGACVFVIGCIVQFVLYLGDIDLTMARFLQG